MLARTMVVAYLSNSKNIPPKSYEKTRKEKEILHKAMLSAQPVDKERR